MRDGSPGNTTQRHPTTLPDTHAQSASLPIDVAKPKIETSVLVVGFDWGTNTSYLLASPSDSQEILLEESIPTIVGYAKEGMVEHLLPDNAKILYGMDAYKNRLHLRLVQPIRDGVVRDLSAARDFASHIRRVLSQSPNTELRAVLGVPANARPDARENLRQAITGLFDRVILIPEPFLAALGYRDETRLGDSAYLDPVNNALFVDIGGGTSDVCLVQGYYPSSEDQLSLTFAGDKVDLLLYENIKRTYPDVDLSIHKVRKLKEAYSFVGTPATSVSAKVLVSGKMRQLVLTEQIGSACQALLTQVFEAVKQIIARAPSDGAEELLRNIILTGGGSRIRGFDRELQRLLLDDGFEQPKVHVVGEAYKKLVAQGALKAALQTKEGQWQQLIA